MCGPSCSSDPSASNISQALAATRRMLGTNLEPFPPLYFWVANEFDIAIGVFIPLAGLFGIHDRGGSEPAGAAI